MNKNIVAQEPRQNQYSPSHWRQLELFPLSRSGKPQIKSVPGASVKERDRYRVMLGDKILRDKLTLDEALRVVKRGGKP
jgi:hypothetical protein